MGLLYDFNRLLSKYSVDCVLSTPSKEGTWEGGDWVPAEASNKSISGAVLPMSHQKIYQSGGSYTSMDRSFVTKEKITLGNDTFIVHDGQKYSVEAGDDYSLYAGFFQYTLKWVSTFD